MNTKNIPKIPGAIITAYRGSIAHGMFVPNSNPNSIDDIDIIGVVVGPKESYLGLQQWGSRGTKEIKQDQYDCVFYETRKMFSLLLQGNPNVLSLLWTEPKHVISITGQGKLLLENSDLFVGKHVYNSFAGYASAQMAKMETRDPAELREYLGINAELKRRGIHPQQKGVYEEPSVDTLLYTTWSSNKLLQHFASYHKKGQNIGYMGEKRKQLVLEHGYDSKNAAHLIRLLRMCKEFLETGHLQVFRKDAKELLDIKQGKWKLEDIKLHAGDLFNSVRVAKEKSKLPEQPNRIAAEKLLIRINSEALGLYVNPSHR